MFCFCQVNILAILVISWRVVFSLTMTGFAMVGFTMAVYTMVEFTMVRLTMTGLAIVRFTMAVVIKVEFTMARLSLVGLTMMCLIRLFSVAGHHQVRFGFLVALIFDSASWVFVMIDQVCFIVLTN